MNDEENLAFLSPHMGYLYPSETERHGWWLKRLETLKQLKKSRNIS